MKRKSATAMNRKVNKAYAIRRHKTPTEFEYLLESNRWGSRSERKKFDNREEAERRTKAYCNVGVHARIVPYGENDE